MEMNCYMQTRYADTELLQKSKYSPSANVL